MVVMVVVLVFFIFLAIVVVLVLVKVDSILQNTFWTQTMNKHVSIVEDGLHVREEVVHKVGVVNVGHYLVKKLLFVD